MAMPGQCYGEDACVICLIKFSENTDAQVTVGEKGLNSLISCSKAAGDLQLEEYWSSYKGDINVHINCRRMYTKMRSAEITGLMVMDSVMPNAS